MKILKNRISEKGLQATSQYAKIGRTWSRLEVLSKHDMLTDDLNRYILKDK